MASTDLPSDDDDDDDDYERDPTPPSRAALTAAELRNLGFEEAHVQRIMKTFRPAEAVAATDGAASAT